jgi:PadR family transcriptional regulator PadR
VQDTLRGHVDLLLLAALGRGPAHGYALADALKERSGGVFELAEGTIYPALYRLERQGLVASSWEDGRTRRRRVYRLTRRGRGELSKQHDAWRGFAHAMEAVLA